MVEVRHIKNRFIGRNYFAPQCLNSFKFWMQNVVYQKSKQLTAQWHTENSKNRNTLISQGVPQLGGVKQKRLDGKNKSSYGLQSFGRQDVWATDVWATIFFPKCPFGRQEIGRLGDNDESFGRQKWIATSRRAAEFGSFTPSL